MNYQELPDLARVWVYQSKREFTPQEVENIRSVSDFFLNGWESHGKKLPGAVEIFHNRFIVVFAYDPDDNMCGRAADASVRFIKQLEEELNAGLMDRMQVAFKQGDRIETTDVNTFRDMLREGTANADSAVFNNLVQTKKEFEHGWVTTVRNSWHANLMPA